MNTNSAKILACLILLLSAMALNAQQRLLFQNKISDKKISIEDGDLVKFNYKGYLGQKEIEYGIVFSIEDSVIEIISPNKQGMISLGGYKTRHILTKDITGFRKFHKSRPYLMTLSSISITAGSIYLYFYIDKKTNLKFGEKLGLSIGSGLISTLIIKAIFPERIKNHIGEEWSLKIVN